VSGTTMLLLAALALGAWGLFMSWLAARFDLDPFGWGIVGAALGPLALAPFASQVRASHRPAPSEATGGAHRIERQGPQRSVPPQKRRPR
jgi:hypothetical protein